MSKQELLHLHALADEIHTYLLEEDEQYEHQPDWDDYASWLDIHRGKPAHKNAVHTKLQDIATYLEDAEYEQEPLERASEPAISTDGGYQQQKYR